VRVLNVVFEDRIGGPTRRIVNVGRQLSGYGVETVLCLPEGAGNAADYARESGIPVRRLDFERIPRPTDPRRVLRWMASVPRDVLRFVRFYREEKPDVVHVNGAFFIVPALAAKLLRIPVVWHLNDTVVPRHVAPVFGAPVRLMADRIVVAAEAVAEHYGVAGAEHDVIYAPVDPAQFGDIVENNDAGPPRVGLVANRLPTKGVEYFIEAAALIRERRGDAEFVLAGAPFPNHTDYYKRTNEMISDLDLEPVLDDRGFVSTVGDVLRDIDVLVLSSTSEASPTVVLEGMAAGLPVVATDVGGVREMLLREPENPAGIVVPPESPGDIAAGALELLDDPEIAAWMGKNGRCLAEEHFSLEGCSRRHLEVYGRLSKWDAAVGADGAGR
jgi:glycosyltransferase involved in cell wall biosynthesis